MRDTSKAVESDPAFGIVDLKFIFGAEVNEVVYSVAS